MHDLTGAVNSAIGILVFGLALCKFPDDLFLLLDSLNPAGWSFFIRTLFFLFSTFSFQVLAVVLSNKAAIMERWLCDPEIHMRMKVRLFNVAVHQATSGAVSLDGAGFFKFSSGFLGSVMF